MKYICIVLLMAGVLSTNPMEKEKKKKHKPSKFLLTIEAKNVSPSDFTNNDLRRSAANIQNAQKYLRFLDNEFRVEHTHYKHRITQFEQLNEYIALYLKYSELENKGESEDQIDRKKHELRIWELKIHAQDRGSCAYSARGKYFARKAKALFDTASKANDEMKKMEKYRRALRFGHSATQDFDFSYSIENCNKRALHYREEMKAFCNMIEGMMHNLPTYRLGLQQAKIAVKDERKVKKQLLSARQMLLGEHEKEKEEEKNEQRSMRKRSNTLESIRKIFPRKKKDVAKEAREVRKKKRHSCPVPELSLPLQDDQLHYLSELNEIEGNLLKVIDSYLTIFERSPNRALINKVQVLLDNYVGYIEDQKASISPHLFTVYPEIGQLTERFQKGLLLLEEQEKMSSASGSTISDNTISSRMGSENF